MLRRSILLIAMLVLFTPERTMGQSAGSACFWPKPIAECKSWIITEPGVHYRLTDRGVGDAHFMFTFSLGLMKNTSALSAFGGEVFGAADDVARWGVALRARRWLSPRSAVDFIGGVHLNGTALPLDLTPGSPMLMTRLTYADIIAASLRLDLLDLRCEVQYCLDPNPQPRIGMSPRLYVGAELGRKPGGTVIAIGSLSLLVLVLLYSRGGWD